MRVTFVYIGVEQLGIESLSAITKAMGHEVDLLFDPSVFGGHLMLDMPRLATKYDRRPEIVKQIIDDRPDILAMSSISATYNWSLSIAREVKEACPEIKVVFGGVHASAVPEVVIAESAVDALVVGEADYSFPALIEMLHSGNGSRPPGAWIKQDGEIIPAGGPVRVADLDSLPIPDKKLFYRKVPCFEKNYTIIAARGCPYQCTYCYNRSYDQSYGKMKIVRRRSVDNVIAELEPVARRGVAEMVWFRDDVFPMSKSWMEEFSKKYKEHVGLPYACFTYPTNMNNNLARMLSESGCRYVTIGIQSADEAQRRNLMNRKHSNERAMTSANAVHDKGMKLLVDHIIGLPGDTVEMMEDAARYYAEMRPDRLLTYWLSFFPGTEIVNIARELGVLDQEEIDNIERGKVRCLYETEGISPEVRKVMTKFVVLFALIPLLPAAMIRTIVKTKFYRLFPSSNMLSSLLLMINAIIRRDPFFGANVKYMFAKKNVP